MDRLIKIVEWPARWLAYLSALLILSMSLWITYDVLTRNLLGWSSPWAFDLSEYALVWMTFLAAPWILLRDGHVRVELVVDAVGVRTQRAIGITVSIIGLMVCLVLAWRTGIAAIEYAQNDVRMARIWNIARIYPYIAVPFGSAALAVAFIARLALYLRDRDPEARLRAAGGHAGGTDATGRI